MAADGHPRMPWLAAALVAFILLMIGSRSAALDHPFESHFAIVVSGADSALARQTVAVLTKSHQEMASASGVWLPDTVRVIFVGRTQSFDSIVGGHFPDWGVACAVADENLIAVRSPRDYPITQAIPEVLSHELAHLHFEAVVGHHRPPRWMNEGYAQQFAHEWKYGDDWVVARAVFMDQALALEDIDGVNSFRDAKARLAYAESYLAMGYFLKTYGWEGLMLLGRSLREGGGWNDGFKAATGADYVTFQKEFAKHLRDNYSWAAFLGDTVLFWILLVLIFIVLYLMKRRRSALKLADWDRQEKIEDVLYSPFERAHEQPGESPTQEDEPPPATR
ncbi:MAG: hypothetical protein HZB43_06855 [candidate division Zixibacteria bacterium]|nr:hypothetical protein [candidate division Zixibacteria bacterium]